ncbi:MAG TPA: pseudaminic acid synthase [Bacillota bacterium]|nr:pseudaminic acid synthase [Clostridiaceae bacterium]HNR03591.1 pseudaminic acid synthase [Bacillota bacterium]HNT02579.1 pseudaminic acid synthase [Bacillota bacterium]HOH89072.1 pseudaminic acid synthase [Bacillota bacterium]HPA54432.1 pseudaminic acid synthase [Bacillota bacterium]
MNEIVLKNGRRIGEDNPCYIMTDIAANHNGDLETAKELIRKAAEAGADAVKFQTYRAEDLYSKKTPQFSRDSMKPYDLIKKVQHPREWIPILSEHAKGFGIDFLSSPFDYDAVDLLDNTGVSLFKVASLEIVDLKLIKYIAGKGKPVVLSTGMASLGEIEEAIEAARSTGNGDIALLHCNTCYPAPAHIVNLKAMETLRNTFRLPTGFSDHTLGWHIPVAAVALGACIIEKHFTLSREQEGPDHGFSIEPEELKLMVRQIRDVEKAMGDGVKKVSREELENYEKGRRSLIAITDIPKGTKITESMITAKRPGYGIKPKYFDMVIGRTAKVDIFEDDVLLWDMLV